MKSTGVIRKIDELGRIVIPKEVRRKLEIDIKDSVEIYVEGDAILLKKYEPGCIFCGCSRNLNTYKGKLICKKCLDQILEITDELREAL